MTKKTMSPKARLRLVRERLKNFLEEIMDSEDPSFTSVQVEDFLIERFKALDDLFASPNPAPTRPSEMLYGWTIKNVQTVRPHLTEEQAWEVLDRASLRTDYNHGICFALLERIADDLFPSGTKASHPATPANGFLAPWTLDFDGGGTGDVATICDRNGHYLVSSLPEGGGPLPPSGRLLTR
jgi:hypothetical protein